MISDGSRLAMTSLSCSFLACFERVYAVVAMPHHSTTLERNGTAKSNEDPATITGSSKQI
jgi:hypothetical protein